MKTFLQVLNEQKDKGYFIDKKGYAVPSKPIHFKMKRKKKPSKKNIKEESSQSLTSLPGQHQDENVQHKANLKLSKTLHDSHPIEVTKSDRKHIRRYSEGDEDFYGVNSHQIAHALITNHKEGKPPTEGMNATDKETHEVIKKHANQPIGHEVHLYSGTGFDPHEAAKQSKDGILHLPAHISTTHDVRVAGQFAAVNTGRDQKSHIMHIHAKPTDKGFHISKHSRMPYEHETILPAGTKLKYSHTTTHEDQGVPFHVHHFNIHSQD